MLISKSNIPTSTVHQSRIALFQATRRPRLLSNYAVQTQWGTVTISGKLGQKHSDVLESLLYCAENSANVHDGRFKILVDLYQVRKHAGIASSNEVNQVIKEIMSAIVSVDFPSKNGGRCQSVGHLIDYMRHAVRSNGDLVTRKNPVNGNQRPLWTIELGKALSDIIKNDHWITTDPLPIAKLSCGICQAIARHVRGHSVHPRGGYILKNLISSLIATDASKQQLYDRIREVNLAKQELQSIGIIIQDGRVTVQKTRFQSILEQNSEHLEQNSEHLEQNSDIWSKTPVLSVLSVLSGTSGIPPDQKLQKHTTAESSVKVIKQQLH